jgi:hypothetical protein
MTTTNKKGSPMKEPKEWPATPMEIGQHFLGIPWMDARLMNWGCTTQDKRGLWNVNRETYINGVALWIDLDFLNGYLLQAVDRTSEIITYVLVVTYPGPDGGHEFVSYPGTAGTLTEQTPEGDPATVGQWAVRTAYGLFDDWADKGKGGKDR